jgi:hypothetical protein
MSLKRTVDDIFTVQAKSADVRFRETANRAPMTDMGAKRTVRSQGLKATQHLVRLLE